MNTSTIYRAGFRSAIGIAVLTVGSLATTGIAQAQQAATAVGRQAWGTDNCLYSWNGTGWAKLAYCRSSIAHAQQAATAVGRQARGTDNCLYRWNGVGWVKLAHCRSSNGAVPTPQSNQPLTNAQQSAKWLEQLNSVNKTLGDEVKRRAEAQMRMQATPGYDINVGFVGGNTSQQFTVPDVGGTGFVGGKPLQAGTNYPGQDQLTKLMDDYRNKITQTLLAPNCTASYRGCGY